MEAESGQAAAQPKMPKTVELQGLRTYQLKEVEPWLLTGSAKRQGTWQDSVQPGKLESGKVAERTKPQKGQYVFAYNERPKSRRKDRLKK